MLMTHCKRLFLLTWLIIFWTNFSYALADNTPPPTNNKNDHSIPLYIRYGYTDSITFIRDQLALSAYPYERVVAYKYGGNTQAGWDCSGFIKYLYGMFNITLPRTAHEMALLGIQINFNQLLPGDLLFFGSTKGVTHVAMVYANPIDCTKKIIHCSTSSGVVINSFEDNDWINYWSKRYLFSRRIVGN